MPTLSAPTRQPSVVVHRRPARLTAVALAVVATLAVWAVASVGFDVELRAPAFGNASENPKIGPGTVAFTTAIGGFAAWAVLALTERLLGSRGRRTWAAIAVVALLASFGGPFSGTGVTDENRLALAAMHLAAAAVLVPLLYRTSTGRQPDAVADP